MGIEPTSESWEALNNPDSLLLPVARHLDAKSNRREQFVLQVLHLRAPSFDASGCNTASYEFISIVRNEEAGATRF
jgi:hypothetical protein